ncbi:MAG: phage tail tape measure protein, partial [Leuconostoc sp.]|nr:phage tail tape measure protein [Leuconostoc sp.]
MAGSTPLGNMVIKLGLDDADFGRGVANSKKQVTYLAKEMQANMKIADLAGNKLGKLGTRYDSLTQIIKAQENQVSSLKKAYDESFVDGKATDSTKRLAAQLQDANGKLANYKTQLSQTAGQLARLEVETQGVTGWMNKHADAYIKSGERIAQVGSNISKVGTALTVGVTAPIVAGVAAVTKAAVDWESAFTGVKKTNEEVQNSNGQVVYSYADLESGLRNLSKELPSSHTQIAAVAEAAGQLGIKTQDVVGFTKVMLDMGESTNLSAEDAATAIARIANITGLTNDEYQRFGSSVVALGNNFATTESDIVDMANRLASAGTLAGLTNQEILGLATSMSSVGIEAEAGGTAMTQTLTAIEQAAASGGEQLDKFASIAGMSSDQFVTTWKNKPIEAIQAFIKGLGELDSKGESATLVLDEMGLSGVRQSNMLKSLALASDTMTSAVDMSNKAWSENTALTKEANTRYETTESKLKMLKNEINDTAIDLGGPFVDALRNGLTAIKPTIEYLGELAKKFNELDGEQQQNIIKWIGIVAAIGPAVKILGTVTKGFGLARTGVGLLNKGLVELAAKAAERSAITATTTAIAGMGTSATTAGAALAGGGAVGGTSLVAGLGAIAGPAAIAVGAIAAVGLAAYAGVKAYEAHQLAGGKWGTNVTKEQDKVIEKSYELREKAVGYVNEYADGIQSSAKKAIKANEDIVTSIENTLKKERERDEKAAQGLYSEAAQKRAQDYLEGQKALDEENIALAKKTTGRINEVLKSASDENRQLSDAERQYIAANYNRLSDEQLKAAGFTKNQRIAIESAYQTDLSKLTTKELQTRAENVVNALDKEQVSYEKQKNKLAEIYGKGTENYKSELAKLNEATKQNNESMILGLAKLTLQQGFSLDQMSGAWTKYGYTTEEVAALVASSNTKTTQNLDMLAKATNEAGIAWNQLALDPKTGEVKTNMADTLVEMAKTDDGWKQLQFMAKNADISTNAKEEIAIAMGEAGKWQFLTIEDKKLLVNGDEAQIALYDTIDKMGLWNQYNVDRKTLGIDNADAAWKLAESNNMIAQWNGLPVEQKTMLADNQDLLNKVLSSQENYNAWI